MKRIKKIVCNCSNYLIFSFRPRAPQKINRELNKMTYMKNFYNVVWTDKEYDYYLDEDSFTF